MSKSHILDDTKFAFFHRALQKPQLIEINASLLTSTYRQRLNYQKNQCRAESSTVLFTGAFLIQSLYDTRGLGFSLIQQHPVKIHLQTSWPSWLSALPWTGMNPVQMPRQICKVLQFPPGIWAQTTVPAHA